MRGFTRVRLKLASKYQTMVEVYKKKTTVAYYVKKLITKS
jgi:hypothetical protein